MGPRPIDYSIMLFGCEGNETHGSPVVIPDHPGQVCRIQSGFHGRAVGTKYYCHACTVMVWCT